MRATARFAATITALNIFTSFAAFSALTAQGRPIPLQPIVPVKDPAVAIEELRSGEAASVNGAVSIIHAAYAGNSAKYTNAQRDFLLSEVTRTARTLTGPGTEPSRTIRGVFSILTMIAKDPSVDPRYRNIVPRTLVSIFDSTESVYIRAMAIATAGELLDATNPDDAARLTTLLSATATNRRHPDQVHPKMAVDALMKSYRYGMPVLRGLNERGAINHEDVRVFVEKLAARGFPQSAFGQNH